MKAEDLTSKELVINVYVTQLIFLGCAVILSYIFSIPEPWLQLEFAAAWNVPAAFFSAAAAVAISYGLKTLLPDQSWDDGGINEKLFGSLSRPHILIMAAVIAFCEEYLFRGALQPLIGLTGSSLVFALLHFRYVKKPFLLLFVVLLSIWLGLLYEWSQSIWIPFLFHFLFDAISGMMIAREYRRNSEHKRGVAEDDE
jgi:membrane protease YdiL (CAAX protease family)